ncbi:MULTISPECIES: GGDEF domain-containing protein [unclassified Dehalobacter]|uniref:GGDEF domain-containing protein n=1 Tax=unclassified Dehalobacter TaxID=2635733 RepID=UPI001FAA458D|nr:MULTISPECIES: GGDEF domain-containing protein [unclassified Dehalobacter]
MRKYFTVVPKENKDEFSRQLWKENFLKLIVIAGFFSICESLLLIFFSSTVVDVKISILIFISLSLLMLPLLIQVYRKCNVYRKEIIYCTEVGYLIILLVFGCALSILPQNELVSINPYIIAVFGLAAFIYLPPLTSLVLYSSIYLFFFLVIPYYQPNDYIVEILRINAFIMNLCAWIFSRMVFKIRLLSLIYKKEIETKNIILADLSVRDSMTSLYNHENIFLKLKEEIERAKRIDYPLSIIMMDIDDFKDINDRFGHQYGDNVIIRVAGILGQVCRRTDIIGRYGGDEFVIILPDTVTDEVLFLAERLRSKIALTDFREGIHITVSGGISELKEESPEELIRKADLQLYKAKANGRNRFEAGSLVDDVQGSLWGNIRG